jgi:uncharacterized SAM-binding protein YcdF (DUF218 family)
MIRGTGQFVQDINCIAAWLALDDFGGGGPDAEVLDEVDVIALLGNQVIATLTAACTLAQQAPRAALLLSGGAGHSTGLLFDNLRGSGFRAPVERGLVLASMAEAEMYAAVAQDAFGIQADRILIENRSTNTSENARRSLQMLKDAGQSAETVLLLQDPVMQRRSILSWARQAEDAGVDSHALSHAVFVPSIEHGADDTLGFPSTLPPGAWTLERFIALLVGEMKRLHDDENGYGPRGRNYLPHVEIPAPVYESYLRVAASPAAAQAVR